MANTTLNDLRPLSTTERKIVERLDNEDEAVAAILNRREYLRENTKYISSLYQEQYGAKFACHNEKETATMPILYEEDI